MGSLEIKSAAGSSRLEFAGPGPRIGVRIVSRELEASGTFDEAFDDPMFAPHTLKAFFADIADHWMDVAASTLDYESPDRQFTMCCDWNGHGHFVLRVSLAAIELEGQPEWRVETTLHLETSMLPDLAARAQELL